MSDIEKKAGESLVDDLLPSKRKEKSDAADRQARYPRHTGYGYGGGGYGYNSSRRSHESSGPLFDDADDYHPYIPRECRADEEESVPAFVRNRTTHNDARPPAYNKAAALEDMYPLHMKEQIGYVPTLLVEGLAHLIAEEAGRILDNTSLAYKSVRAHKKLASFLRSFILDECYTWDDSAGTNAGTSSASGAYVEIKEKE